MFLDQEESTATDKTFKLKTTGTNLQLFGKSLGNKQRPDRAADPLFSEAMPTTQKPRKAILSQEQLVQFQGSQCHKDIVSYIESLNASVTGVKLSDECPQSPVSGIISRVSDD